MVATISGSGLGLFNGLVSSQSDATLGQGNESVFVNTTTGNLLVRQRDEFLTSQGLDTSLFRTYNSQGEFDADNNDNWRLNVYQELHSQTGTVNTEGSSITKVLGDGHESVYTFDVSLGLYISHEGSGAQDTLSYDDATSTWLWNDDDAGISETYNAALQIISLQDADANQRTYTYTGDLITEIHDSSGQSIFLDYSGTNLTQIRTVSNGLTQVRTHYAYDLENRLEKVTVDLSPEDSDITDANTYITQYTYDGLSNRITSITSGDGTNISFTYDVEDRVETYTDGAGQQTVFSYSDVTAEEVVALTADNAQLADTISTDYALDNVQLSTTDTTDYAINNGSLSTTDTTDYAVVNGVLSTTDTADYAINNAALSTTDTTDYLINSASLSTTDTADFAINTASLSTTDTVDYTLINTAISTTDTADYSINNAALSTTDTTEYSLANGVLSTTDTQDYSVNNAALSTTDTADYGLNNAALSTTDTTDYSLNSALLSVTDTADYTLNIGALSTTDSANHSLDITALSTSDTQITTADYSLDATKLTSSSVSGSLQNGISVNDLSGLAEDKFNFTIEVPAGASQVSFQLSGGLGDADLYITYGSAPTSINYDYASREGDNNEIITIAAPEAGTWHILVEGYSDFSSTSLVSQYSYANPYTQLANSIAQTGIAGLQNEQVTYRVEVPVGATDLNIQMSGGIGDADLYVRYGDVADSNEFDYYSSASDNTEEVIVAAPTAGTWYVTVEGWYDFSGVSLISSYTYAGNEVPLVNAGIDQTVNANDMVTLSGSAIDIDGTIASYNWVQVSGPVVSLSSPSSATTNFNAPLVTGFTALKFELTAIDNIGGVQTDIVTILVEPAGSVYTIQNGDTWASIATALYGTADVADELQSALGSPVLVLDNTLSGFSAVLTDTVSTTVTVPAYYRIQSGDTWATIASKLYLTADVANELQTTLGNPALTVGSDIIAPPVNIIDTFSTDPYYRILAGDTWASISTKLYGSDLLADELQAALILAHPSLTVGTDITTAPVDLTDTFTTAAYYRVQTGDTWSSIALALYGTDLVANKLQTALGDPVLTVGTALTAIPDTLTDTFNVAAYYRIQESDTWTSIATSLYGSANVADDLQAALGAPALVAGNDITTAPISLTDTFSTAPYYRIQLGDTWASIALSLYGSDLLADELQSALVNPALTAGTDLTAIPASLTDTFSVAPYYRIQTGDTWASIATSLYGSANVADELQSALGNPTLTVGTDLTGIPASLTDTFSVAPYYRIQTGDTWASIASSLYTTNLVGDELQITLGNPVLTVGSDITTAPASLTDTFATAAYYRIQTGDTWASIANTLYGTANVADELEAALASPALIAGNDLTGIAATLVDTISVAPYYRIQTGDSWASIATTLYGTDQVADELSTALGNPVLTPGNDITTAPASLTDTFVTAPYYRIQSGDTWASIALALYGTDLVADELQTALGSPLLTIGDDITTAPASLTDTFATASYYRIQTGDTWGSIALALYGTDLVADELQTALGNPTLTVGNDITTSPASLTDTFTTAPYYRIQTGDTWASIATTIYGTANVADELQAALSNPALTVGADLINMPATLSDTYSVSPYYRIQTGDTWSSIALTLYGTPNVADELQTALGNPALTAGTDITTAPASITDTFATPAYYRIQSGDTWASIATKLYATDLVADELQTAMGNPALTVGTDLVSLPTSLTNVVTVAPYYTVQTGDSWSSIAQTVYGDSLVVDELQTYFAGQGINTLNVGDLLTMPASLSYDTVNITGKQANIIDPLGYVTSYQENLDNQLVEILSPAVNGQRLSTQYNYDANGNILNTTDANGNQVSYTYDSLGNLTQQQDSEGNTVSYIYSETNKLLNETFYLVADPDGLDPDNIGLNGSPAQPLTTRNIYDNEDHLRFVVSVEGRVTQNNYNPAGERTSSIIFNEAIYDINLLTETDTLGEALLDDWLNLITLDLSQTQRVDYTYDFRGNLDTTTTYESIDALGNGVIDGTERVTQFIYDQAGQLLHTMDSRGYALAHNNDQAAQDARMALGYAADQTLLTDQDIADLAEVYTTHYTYDGLGRLRKTTDALNQATITTYDDVNNQTTTTLANGLATTSSYNASGLLISQSQTSPDATVLGTSSYVYDKEGQLRYTQDPLGQRDYLIYDEAGRIIATVDTSGAMTETVYDNNGNVSQTIAYARRLSENALATLVEIDGNGDLEAIDITVLRAEASTDENRTSTIIYDKASRAVITLSPHDTDASLAYVTQNFYDGAGRVIDVIQYATEINTSLLPATLIPDDITGRVNSLDLNNRHSRVFYNNDGQVIASLDAEGYLNENSYNDAGQLTQSMGYATQLTNQKTHSKGDLTAIKSEVGTAANDRAVYSFYNARGEVIASIDADNYLTEYAYDLSGNQTDVVSYDTPVTYTGSETITQLRPASINTDSASVTVYDELNRIKTTTNVSDSTTTEFEYDSVSNVIRTTFALNTDDVRTLRTEYDAAGRVKTSLTAQGSVVLDTLLQGTYTQTDIDALWDTYGVSHTYDAKGRLLTTTDQNQNTTWHYYDENDRLTVTIQSADGGLDATGAIITNQGSVSKLSYNTFGQVIDTTQYANRISTSGLIGGSESSIATQLELLGDAINDGTSSINYTLRGAIKSALNSENYQTTNTYNVFGEKETSTQQLDKLTTPTTVTSRYAYDKRGLLTDSIEDATGKNRQRQVTYDAFGRIKTTTDANNNSSRIDYSTDTVGRKVVTTTDSLTHSTITTYDAFDRVLTQTDKNNNTVSYSYDDAQRSLTITTQEGISTTTIKNRLGETFLLTDGNNNTTKYDYDKNGNLKTITEALGSINEVITNTNDYDNASRLISTFDAKGIETKFGYDAVNRVISQIHDPIDIAINPDGLNITTQYRYDTKGQTVHATDANGTVTTTQYDKRGQVKAVTLDPFDAITNPDGLNLRTEYAYDGRGKTLTVIEGAGTVDARSTEYQYDKLDRRIQTTIDPDGLVLTTNYEYDKNDNVVATTDANLNVTRYIYDKNNQQIYTVNAEGGVVKTDYSRNGQVVKTTSYTQQIDVSGFVLNITEADVTEQLVSLNNDIVDRYAYDKDNRLIFSVNSSGGMIESIYDDNNNVIRTTAYVNRVSVADIDAAIDRVTHITALLIEDGAKDQTVRTVYDFANRAVFSLSVYEEAGASYANVTEQAYDVNGNVLAQASYDSPINLSTAVFVNATSPTTNEIRNLLVINQSTARGNAYVYDNADRLRYKLDAMGYIIENQYNNLGQITQTSSYKNQLNYVAVYLAAGINTSGLTPEQILNYLPTVLSEATFVAGITLDINNDQTTQFKYDAAHRVYEEVYAVGTLDEYSELYAYDSSSNVIRHTNGNSDSEYFAYDAVGRVERTVDYMGYVVDTTYDGSANINTRTTYMNKVGLPEPTSPDDRWAYNVTNPVVNLDPESGDRVDTYTYDNTGQLETYTAPSINNQAGSITRYVYDALGQLTDTIDAEGLVEQRTTHIEYNALGEVVEEVSAYGEPEASRTIFSYDTFGNQVGIIDPRGIELAEQDTSWAQDERERLGYSALTSALTFVEQEALKALYTTMQEFDQLNRKTAAINPLGGRTQTDYDAFGNIVITIDANTNVGYFYYDNLNRTTLQVDPEGYATRLEYDAYGNVVDTYKYANKVIGSYDEKSQIEILDIAPDVNPPQAYLLLNTEKDQLTHAEYDGLNRTSSITDAENYTEDFSYDAMGNVLTHIDKNRNIFTYGYDALGRKVSEILPVTANKVIDAWDDTIYKLDSATGTTASPQIAYDAFGNATAVWAEFNGVTNDIYFNKFVDGIGWQEAQLLESGTGASYDPQISADELGNIFVIWRQAEGVNYNTYVNHYVVNVGWSGAEVIQALPDNSGGQQIAMDSEGNAIAVWYQTTDNKISLYANFYNAENGWQGPELIETGIGAVQGPKIEFDDKGNAIVVWYQNDGTATSIYANHYEVGVGWKGAQLLETENGYAMDPQISFNGHGNATVMWSQYNGTSWNIYSNHYDVTSGWQGTQLIETAPGNASSPQIDVNADGNAVIVWRQFEGNAYVNYYSVDTGWQGVQLLEAESGMVEMPNVSMDVNGNAIATWSQQDGTGYSVFSNRYEVGSGWQGVELLEKEVSSNFFGINIKSPQVTYDGNGNAMLVWSINDGTSKSIHSRQFLLQTKQSVVNRFEYDALSNLTKAVEAEGLPEQRITEFSYNKIGKKISSIEPGVLVATEKTNTSGFVSALDGGTVTFTNYVRFEIGHNVGGNPEGTHIISGNSISWPLIEGYGNGDIKLVSNGSVVAIVDGSQTSYSGEAIVARIPAPITPSATNTTFTYEVYKETINGDVLIASKSGTTNYVQTSASPGTTYSFTTSTTKNDELVFTLSSGAETLRLWYYPVSNPNDLIEVDVIDGKYNLPELSGEYAFIAKSFDINGEVLDHFKGAFNKSGGVLTSTFTLEPVLTGELQNQVTTTSYDAAGNVITETDAKGNVSYHYYDNLHRRIASIDAERYLHEYYYDAVGNVIRERDYGDKLDASINLVTMPDVHTLLLFDETSYRETYYRYNANNQMLESQSQSVLVYDRVAGQRNQILINSQHYDANGNVVKTTDANENSAYTYYNKIGKRVLTVDALGHATAWSYDANGSVSQRIQYASALVAPTLSALSVNSDVSELVSELEKFIGPNDRISQYTYDKTNRLKTEEILNIDHGSIDVSGNITELTDQTVITTYEYDGLGNITAVINPGGARTDYQYDVQSRLTQKQGASFTDDAGTIVRTTQLNQYDGVGNIIAEVEKGKIAVDDQITRFEYDPSGNLIKEIDALGSPKVYYYDLNGNLTLKHERRTRADGVAPSTDTVYVYDNLNRLISTEDNKNFIYHVAYNAYGEIESKGLNGIDQEYFEYDKAGHLFKTNKDGVDKAYLYDANGNATAEIQSSIDDTDIQPLSIDAIAALSPALIKRTESSYDAKNQLVASHQAPIEFTHDDVAIQEGWIDVIDDPFVGGDIGFSRLETGGAVSFTNYIRFEIGHYVGGNPEGTHIISGSSISWPLIEGYGNGNIKLVSNGSIIATVDGSQTSYSGETLVTRIPAPVTPTVTNTSFNYQVYKETIDGDVLIASEAGTTNYVELSTSPGTTFSFTTMTQELVDNIVFTGLSNESSEMDLWIWTVGGSKPAIPKTLAISQGQALIEWRNEGFVHGDYNIEYKLKNNANEELDYVKGTVSLGYTSTVNTQEQYQIQPVATTSPSLTSNIIERSQKFNAFGEVIEEIDGRGNITNLTYNIRGELIRKELPQTDVTLADATLLLRHRPTTDYVYDINGRLIAEKDANSNLAILQGQAGYYVNRTSYDDADQVLAEYRAHGGVREYAYDVFGNTAYFENENNYRTHYIYNDKNQLFKVDRPTDTSFDHAVRFEEYKYDEFDRRIAHRNLNGYWEYTYYDDIGRVIRTVDYETRATHYRYIYNDITGGIETITTLADGRSLSDTHDYFGRIINHKDMGDRVYTYHYNKAGWLTHQESTAEQNIDYSYYHNGYIEQVIDHSLDRRTKYEYDNNGNRTFEGIAKLTSTGGQVYYQWSNAEYDELNRLKSINDPKYNLSYEYDANGNKRHVYARYHDGLNNGVQHQDYWYTYDKQNRFNMTKGEFTGVVTGDTYTWNRGAGVIQAGAEGVHVGYDAAGNRTIANNEKYYYNADNLLERVDIDAGTGLGYKPRATRTYDAAGNVKVYTELAADGLSVNRKNTYTYYKDNKSKTDRFIDNLVPSDTPVIDYTSTYTYDAAGNIESVYQNQTGAEITTTYTYEYWDSAKQKQIKINGVTTNYVSDWKPGFSDFTYDVNGHLTQVSDRKYKNSLGNEVGRDLSYKLDQNGKILQRNELIGTETSRTQYFYYMNGRTVGDAGGFGTSKTDYEALLQSSDQSGAERIAGTREKEYTLISPVSSADFDQNFIPISNSYPATTPGTYTVAYTGQKTTEVAQAVWGDSSLWYIIADANGLNGDESLIKGQNLIIPNVVTNVHNNADTFKVYNPGELLGNTSPTLPETPPPPPPPKDSCLALKAILVVVVAVVVTYFTAGALGGAVGPWTAAVLGAMAGSVASQNVAIGFGMQESFSWEQVGIAGLTAGLTQGLNIGEADSWLTAAGKAITSNAIGQGINMAYDLQEEFSWESLYAAAIAAPINSAIKGQGKGITNATSLDGSTAKGFGIDLLMGIETNFVNQAAKIIVNGEGKIDWGSVAVNAIGASVGGAINAEIGGSGITGWRNAENRKIEKNLQQLNLPHGKDSQGNFYALSADEIKQGIAKEVQELSDFHGEDINFETDKFGNTIAVSDQGSFVVGEGKYVKNVNNALKVNVTDYEGNLVYDNNKVKTTIDARVLTALTSAAYAGGNSDFRKDLDAASKKYLVGWERKDRAGYQKILKDNGGKPEGMMQGSSKEIGAVSSFYNQDTSEAALSFKGSFRKGDWFDDLDFMFGGVFGADTYETIRNDANTMLQDLSAMGVQNSQIYSVGHSLGGGLAQSFALENSLNGAGLNALPVSNLVLNANGGTSSIENYRNNPNLEFSEYNVTGEIATAFYSTALSQNYLDDNPTKIHSNSPFTEGVFFGSFLLGQATSLSTAGWFTPAAGGSGMAHMGGTAMNVLNNYDVNGPGVDSNQINWGGSYDDQGQFSWGVRN